MAFVDVAYLKKTDLRDGIIRYVRHKTGQVISVRLEPCMKEIIDRYAHQTKHSPYLLPILRSSNEFEAYDQYQNALSYYNKQLKKISRLLEIGNSLSSYVSRHTWATIARDKNIPLAVISAGMGHSSQLITQIYLASLEDSVVDEANLCIISSIIGL